MLKNNGPYLENKNNASPYLNWFTKDAQELKRGGTAPIMNSRKNRPPVPIDAINGAELMEQDVPNIDNVKNIPIITTSYGTTKVQNPIKVVPNPTAEGHKITKIYTNSGVSAYRLTKKTSIDESNKPGLLGRTETTNQNNNLPVDASQRFEKKSIPASEQQEENYRDLVGNSLNFGGFGGIQSIASNRPQTSHYKGNGAFRRGRILNESSQNFEEYQTPNTGNLELESLHLQNLNLNQASEKISNAVNQFEHKNKQNSFIKNNNEQRLGHDNHFDHEFAENYPAKQLNEHKQNQGADSKYKDNKSGAMRRDEGNQDKGNEPAKITRLVPAEGRYNRAKQIMEGRRYAEDIQTFSIGDNDEHSKKESTNAVGRDQEKNTKRNKDASQDDFVSMIGRSCREDGYKKNETVEKNENEMNIFKGSPQKFSLDHGEIQDVDSVVPQQTPGQRPPARKNGQAMNLNERCTIQQDKKPTIITTAQIHQVIPNVRPPSRHKIPNKALGLDLPEENAKSKPEVIQNFAGEDIFQKRDQITRKSSQQQSDDFGAGFENKDFDSLNFNKVLDLSDFLDGEEQNTDLRRPNTTFMNQRSNLQSSQGTRPRMDSGKHAGLQSAKPKQATDANLWGHNFQSSSKADPFEKSRGNKNQKDAKTDNVFDVIKNNKARTQSKIQNDLEGFDVLNFNSESDDSENSLKKKRSMLQSAKPALGGNTSKNNFLSQYKDKKSKIVFIYNKESHATKKDNVDLPFETTLEKDFVGLFAN